MAKQFDYITTFSGDRLVQREVVFVNSDFGIRRKNPKRRQFVPSGGLNGQILAGTGALVFEGEVLDLELRS